MSTGRTVSRGRVVVFGLTSAMAVLLITAVAFACTIPEGTTYFTDGKISKSVFRGSRVSAYATGARVNVQYKLVIGENGPHPTHACMVTDYTVNNTVLLATSDHFLGSTSGPAGDANLALGTYQLCFVDFVNQDTGTSAATLTII